MKVYFLSLTPCVLSINGTYFGVVNNFEKFVSVNLSDELLITLTPENSNPISFFLREDIRFSPPENCEVYLLKDGIAIYAYRFPPCDFSLQVVCQKRKERILATVYKQGELFLSIHDEKNLFVATLPPSFIDCELIFEQNLLLLHTQTQVAVFTHKAECLLLQTMQKFALEDGVLSLCIPLSDLFQRFANCRFKLENDTLTQVERTLVQPSEDERTPPDGLLAYALFESILLQLDFTPLLSDTLQRETEKLRAYLGNFISVNPTLTPNVCALVYKKSERLFDVREYAVDIQNGKIDNISLI